MAQLVAAGGLLLFLVFFSGPIALLPKVGVGRHSGGDGAGHAGGGLIAQAVPH